MASKIGKISPIKRKFSKDLGISVSSSLADNNMTRWPGTAVLLWPHKEKDGSYRTGLDEEAHYIKLLEKSNPEEAKMEKARVRKALEEVKLLAGNIDLSSRSDFYSKPFDNSYNTDERVQSGKLQDKPNIFKLGNFMEAVTYYWLRVHPSIAPSYNAWESNSPTPACPDISQCKFFVDDIEYEAEVAYKVKAAINNAVSKLGILTPTRRLQVGKLLGLPVASDSKEELVYNLIDDFIKAPSKKHESANVEQFNMIVTLSDANINLRYKIRQGFDASYFRNYKGKIYRGQEPIAKNEDELIELLLDDKNQDDLLALEENIKAQASMM